MADYISFQPKDHFSTKLYTGNNSSSHAITGVGFQPDWTWIKARNFGESHRIYDAVRGASNHIASNANVAQSSSYPLTSFDSNGFTIGSADGSVNGNYNYTSWNWKANGAGSANSDGTISSTVSANTTAGFSIVTYTGNGSAGSTVGHGLGTTPKFIIVKSNSDNYNWTVYYGDATDYLVLNDTAATTDSNEVWNDTAPTSTVFTVGNRNSTNQNTATFVAYCFAEKQGFSSIGTYVGNSSTYGKFINTGFRPALVMIKRYDSGSEDWNVFDNKRIGYNVSGNDKLYWNLSSAESTTGDEIDFLANGFKLRTTNGGLNNNGGSYTYLAFAEQPFVASNDTPAVAR